MKSVVPVPEDEAPQDIRLFEVSFMVPVPSGVEVPKGLKAWMEMLWIMKGVGEENGTPEIVLLTRVNELRNPIETDTVESMQSVGSF